MRIMPNTPSAIGHGVIALAPTAEVTAASVDTLKSLLSGAGLVVDLDESQIPAMTGISGSGVAYFFLLAEAMIAAGVKQGLSEDVARQMVVATADGAGRLLTEKPDPAAQRQAVSSKGGTTLAGLQQFLDSGIFDIAEAAAQAAADRSWRWNVRTRRSSTGEPILPAQEDVGRAGDGHGLMAGPCRELDHRRIEIGLHRRLAQRQRLGDAGIRPAQGDMREDVGLPRRQPDCGHRRLEVLRIVSGENIGQARLDAGELLSGLPIDDPGADGSQLGIGVPESFASRGSRSG